MIDQDYYVLKVAKPGIPNGNSDIKKDYASQCLAALLSQKYNEANSGNPNIFGIILASVHYLKNQCA